MHSLAKILLAGALALALPVAASAQQCPSYAPHRLSTALAFTAQSLWTAHTYPAVAGGQLYLSHCAAVPGAGYVTPWPDFSIQYDAQGLGRALEFRVVGQCDATLLVNDANAQWHFDDDTNGFNPLIRIPNARSGRYDIWVGRYDMQRYCDVELVFETF